MKKSLRVYSITACMLALMMFSAMQGVLAASPEGNPPDVQIRIDNFTFTPPDVIVKVGTHITWTNSDDIPHTVVSTDNAFKSKTLDTDDKFSFTPNQPGTYSYFCSIHPKMTAKVVVQ
jgi:plastocyanin